MLHQTPVVNDDGRGKFRLATTGMTPEENRQSSRSKNEECASMIGFCWCSLMMLSGFWFLAPPGVSSLFVLGFRATFPAWMYCTLE